MRRLTQLVTLEHTLHTTYKSLVFYTIVQYRNLIFYFIFHMTVNFRWMKTYILCLIFSSSIHELQNIWIKSTLCTITWCNLRIIAKRSNVTIMISFPFSIEGFIQTMKRSSFETSKLNANIKSIVNNKSMNENCIQNIFWMNKQKYLLYRFLRSNV